MTQQGYQVVMPKLGLIMTEAQLIDWCKQDGEKVEKGEILFTMESEKSTLEIESPASGFVQQIAKAGEIIPVNAAVAVITQAAGSALPTGESQKAALEPASESAPAGAAREPSGRSIPGLRATPMVRFKARQSGIDLSVIEGSGPRGMVVLADLGKAPAPVKATPLARKMAASKGVDLSAIKGTGPRGAITRSDIESAAESAALPAARPVKAAAPVGHATPLTGLRAVIAERLSQSWNERPQVTLVTELEATNLVSARRQINEQTGGKVSYNAFFILAAARALSEHPGVNASLTNGGLTLLEDINVGLAVDTERGLLVPVIRDAAQKTLFEIDKNLKELAERALAGSSLPDELSGGTFTISNLGAFGIDAFTPIINPPESAILGVGRIKAQPVVVEGQVVPRDMMTLVLSHDHRLLDGAPAARFLQSVAHFVENPLILLV
jgi:pyruvate dehydrogenase E2 component (dihydrolipoamide acetyltransferase)